MASKYFIDPFAVSGDRATVPDAAPPDGSVSYSSGFGVDYQLDPTSGGGLNIPRTQFNELIYDITQAIQTLQQHGFPDFISTSDNGGAPFPYDANSTVRYMGINYYSLVDGNTDTPPSSKWGMVSYGQTFVTGDMLPWAFSTIRGGGWLWMNGTTIGDASSGATQRANADTAGVFSLNWTDYTNAVLPIQNSDGSAGSRGISAAADFAAHKRLPMPDYRGRALFGNDAMGGAATAGRITNAGSGITGTIDGASGGVETVALNGNQNGTHAHSGTTDTSNANALIWIGGTNAVPVSGPGSPDAVAIVSGTNVGVYQGLDGPLGTPPNGSISATSAATHSHTFTTSNSGLGSAHQNMPPAIIAGGYIMKI